MKMAGAFQMKIQMALAHRKPITLMRNNYIHQREYDKKFPVCGEIGGGLKLLPGGVMNSDTDNMYALSIITENRAGVLRDVATVMADYMANIQMIQQSIIASGPNAGRASIYLEFNECGNHGDMVADLARVPSVIEVTTYPPFSRIFGSRVIIIGGGAQVAQVAMGAVNEADRHNIRGERISVDTIPLVGEQNLALAVDAVARLPRASILVLAGSLMGGEVSRAVDRVRAAGIPVIALKMAGSVPQHADLVVTDPIQAGVFAVMHISKTAVFDINRVRGREF
jgi:energy-converting hydrogenase B subunit Q